MSKYIDAERLKTWLENEADMEFKKTEENANSPVLCHFHNGCRMQALDTIDFITSLQQEQPEEALSKPELPSNLDEAAENRVTENGRFKITSFEKMRIDDIIFGAEWVAGQGVTKEAVIGMATEEISINVSQQTLDKLDLCPGDKVVVQIRKIL